MCPKEILILPSIFDSAISIASKTSFNLFILEEQALVVETITFCLEKALTSTSPLTPGNPIFII